MISKYERMSIEEFSYAQAHAYMHKLKKQGRIEDREQFRTSWKELQRQRRIEQRKVELERTKAEMNQRIEKERKMKEEFYEKFSSSPVVWDIKEFPRTSWDE